jgi:hypothetical protein
VKFFVTTVFAKRDHVRRPVKIFDASFLVMKRGIAYRRNLAATVRGLADPLVILEAQFLMCFSRICGPIRMRLLPIAYFLNDRLWRTS